jgi:hypothetical protein
MSNSIHNKITHHVVCQSKLCSIHKQELVDPQAFAIIIIPPNISLRCNRHFNYIVYGNNTLASMALELSMVGNTMD